MKKLIQVFLAVFIVSAFAHAINRFNASEGFSGGNTLTVFNWGDYIDMELIEQFEEETGITVIYETFDSNEAMMTKIQQGGTTYDIAVPSEYMIEKMMEEDLLIRIGPLQTPQYEIF